MMTTGLLSVLEDFYHGHIERVSESIDNKYECFNITTDKIPNPSEELIRKGIKIDVEGRSIEIIVGFPSTFPDALPKLYLSQQDLELYYPLPHLTSKGLICTRASDVIDINDRKVEEATLQLIEIGIEDLKNNIGRGFNEEFKDEFIAYWEDQASYRILLLSGVNDGVKRLTHYSLSKKVYGTKELISDSDEKVKKWANNLGIRYEEMGYKALYLPLKNIDQLPENNGDIYQIFKNSDDGTQNTIETFYNSNSRNRLIIISLDYSGKLFVAFKHKNWSNETFDGFRENNIPLNVRLGRNANDEIKKIGVVDLDKKRLLRRGGIPERGYSAELKIIGCGSVGSHLGMSLAKGGINELTLIDHDYLKPENIHRHLCGFSYLVGNTSISKTEAVKNHIQSHLPNTEINVYHKNVLQLLMEHEDFFTGGDFLIVATAERSVERRINKIVCESDLNLKLIVLWLEPYGIGGHLLYIDPDNGGCYECCLDEYDNFKYTFSKPGQIFNKREAGCQSSFIPYSNVELEQFVHLSAEVIFEILNGRVSNCCIYSWFLNPEIFKEQGYLISDYWLTAKKFAFEKNDFNSNPECRICNNE